MHNDRCIENVCVIVYMYVMNDVMNDIDWQVKHAATEEGEPSTL